MAVQQSVMEPKSESITQVQSGIKSILLHVIDDDSFDQRIETALSLSRACSAHLSCVHVTPIEAYVAFDSFGGVFVMQDVISKLDQRDIEIKAKVEERLRSEDVCWDYDQVTGNVVSTLVGRAALADLVIAAREPPHHDYAGSSVGLLGDLLHRSTTPLFIPARKGKVDPTGPALIAWNGSVEAANAVRGALGILRLSRSVHVLQVTEEKIGPKAFPGTKLLEYLSRQGIHAELAIESSPDGEPSPRFIVDLLMTHAGRVGAATLVIGGYGHTRMGEYIFGGVTRTLLKDSPLAMVIAH